MYTLDTFQQRFGANPAFAERLARVFLSEGPRQLAVLRSAVDGAVPADVERAAHTLKGAVANYGYPELVQTLATMEEQAAPGPALEARFVQVASMVEEMADKLALAVPAR